MIKQVYGLLSEISPPSQKQRERMESSGSSSGSKRARAAGQQQQQQVVVSCLVDGCKSDLSKCRDYHRRHKVCEVHSKTGRVSIGGREQRFCQQCSRFHSLGEFDEGKRSCRKRLEGHNRRRRKPQQQPADPSAIKPSTFGGGYLAFGSGSHMMSSGNSPAAMFSSQSQQQRRFPFLQSVGATSSSSGGSQLGLDRALSLLSSSSPSLIASSALNYTTTINNSQSNCNCNISGGGGGVGIQGSQLLPPNSATIHHCQDVSFHAAAAAAAAASSSQSQQTLSFLWE